MKKEIKVAFGGAIVAALVGVGLLGLHLAPKRDPLPSEKRAAINQLMALEQKARQGVAEAAKPAKPTPPDPNPEPEKSWGVMSVDIGPLPSVARGYTLENKWLGEVDGVFTVIYAGRESDNPEQGVLIIWQPDGDKPPEVCRTDKPVGALRIEGVSGGKVKLQSGIGALTFDMTTDLYQ